MTEEQAANTWMAGEGRVVDLAIDIRSVLSDLIGSDWFLMDLRLDALIERATKGENTVGAITAALRSNPRTSRWLDLALANGSAAANATLIGEENDDDADSGTAGVDAGEGAFAGGGGGPGNAGPPGNGGGLYGGGNDVDGDAGASPGGGGFDPGELLLDNSDPVVVAPTTRGIDFGSPGQRAKPPLPRGIPADPRGDPPPRDGPPSYALIDCPDVVVAGKEFELGVGLSDVPADGVISDGPIEVPNATFSLTIDIHAEGFTLRDGDSWRQSIRVTPRKRYPRLPVHLVADAQAQPFKPRTISASFTVNGQVVSLASRFLIVMAAAADVANAPAPDPVRGVGVRVPTDEVAPDLTARILTNRDRPGTYSLVLVSRWEGSVAIPATPFDVDFGNAQIFLTDLVNAISIAAQPLADGGDPDIYRELLGRGSKIAALLPAAFWTTLTAVAQRVQRPPSVLFLTQEPFIPWELAAMSNPLDAKAPPFLGAQADVARWILGTDIPIQPPPAERDVPAMAVVFGDYTGSGWDPLPQATTEANGLVDSYGAIKVDARLHDVQELLRGRPAAAVIHFATHGQYDEDGQNNGLIMVDGAVLNTYKVVAERPLTSPFVFLNACQVGAGKQILAGASGLAAEFVNAGAAGVVAPLWSVNDTIARQIADAFYADVLGPSGLSPAEALRRARQAFRDDPKTSPTYLAYQFFGAPNMHLVRSAPADPAVALDPGPAGG